MLLRYEEIERSGAGVFSVFFFFLIDLEIPEGSRRLLLMQCVSIRELESCAVSPTDGPARLLYGIYRPGSEYRDGDARDKVSVEHA